MAKHSWTLRTGSLIGIVSFSGDSRTYDVLLERDLTHRSDRLVLKDLRNKDPWFYGYIYPSVTLSFCTSLPF